MVAAEVISNSSVPEAASGDRLGGVHIPTPGADSAVAGASTSTAIPDITFAPAQQPNLGPRLVLPATGGTPVFAIPLGGDIYLPVTDGVPVIGITLAP